MQLCKNASVSGSEPASELKLEFSLVASDLMHPTI